MAPFAVLDVSAVLEISTRRMTGPGCTLRFDFEGVLDPEYNTVSGHGY